MRKLQLISSAVLTMVVTAATSSTAAADSVGTTGRVASIEVNTTGSDDAGSHRGKVSIQHKGKQQEYRWGGASCPGKDLDAGQIALLVTATERGMLVTPRYKQGQGGARCLVGFSLTRGHAHDGGPS